MSGRGERFFRLDDVESGTSSLSDSGLGRCEINVEGSSPAGHVIKTSRRSLKKGSESSSSDFGLERCEINAEGSSRAALADKTSSRSFKKGVKKGSEGLKSFGRSLGFGVARAVFPEDVKVSEKKMFDPQAKCLLLWNKLFFVSFFMAVFVDFLFFYLPVINNSTKCLGMDQNLAIVTTTLRTVIDVFYLVRMALQFRTAYIAPSSRVFGRGEVVTDPAQVAKRYLSRYFIVDFLAVLPIPQIMVWRHLQSSKGLDVLTTHQAFLFTILLQCVLLVQCVPRVLRVIPLYSEMKGAAGVFVKSAWAGAAYYLLLYILASHIVGTLWYMLAWERNAMCWHRACKGVNGVCDTIFLYCGNQYVQGYGSWASIRDNVLQRHCSGGDNSPFDFGIYKKALSSNIILSSTHFVPKFFYCLWWGLQNLSTLGQGLETSTFPGEIMFCLGLAVAGLILFALLIGKMQTYIQSHSNTIRLEEELRVKQRDTKQWMNHRRLPEYLRRRVRRHVHYKWLETRGAGVDEETLLQSLPVDLRRDIMCHLSLDLVRRVPLFEYMGDRSLDAICERLKPCHFTETSYLVREGDPVDKMFFITRGRLESVSTDGGRAGFSNRVVIRAGDFCGEELLTWAFDPKSDSNLPFSTRTVRALTEVEAFALKAEELKFVASLFRRLHSKQIQHIFRHYSQQWRTWAACFIQAKWRRYSIKKNMKLLHRDGMRDSCRNLATFTAFVFAADAILQKNTLQKPPEPDFTAVDAV